MKPENRKETVNRDTPMPLSSHFRELRNRLIVCVLLFAAAFLVFLHFAGDVTNALTAMGQKYGYSFVFIAPQELIMVYFQIAMVGGVVVSLPAIVYELYAFAAPALEEKTKKPVALSLIFGFVMFAIGALFAYFVSIPFMLYFLISLRTGTMITASISIQSFVSFVLTVFLIFGAVFEMPVVSSLLARLGVLKPQLLVKARKISVVVIFIIAAIITPPDIISQITVAVPMVLLYEVSIWICRIIYKGKNLETETA
jgi:sec-independent protein translocase protein TatC